MVGLDERTGTARWTAEAQADELSIVAGGRVVVAEDDKVRALGTDDGKEAGRRRRAPRGASILDADDETVLVADGDGTMAALALADGTERWSYDSGGPSVEAEIVGDDVYVAAGEEGSDAAARWPGVARRLGPGPLGGPIAGRSVLRRASTAGRRVLLGRRARRRRAGGWLRPRHPETAGGE